MTKVEIFRKNGSIVGYKASGHSGYSEQGSDIICSAITTSLQMTLAGIQEVLKLKPKFKINDGFLDVDLKDISQFFSSYNIFISILPSIYWIHNFTRNTWARLRNI